MKLETSVYYFSKLQLILFLLVYLYLGVIEIPDNIAGSFNDLLFHGLGYGLLIISGLFAFPNLNYLTRLFLIFLVYSFLIECIQYSLPHRSFSWLDMAANATGLLVGSAIGYFSLPLLKLFRFDLKISS